MISILLKFSKKQWSILIIFSVINILLASCISIQGPFYPMVAERKGAVSLQYGVVFGAFSLAFFFVSPLSGFMINKFDAVKVSFVGLIISGIASLMFGFVDNINGITTFISISVIIRIAEGLGSGMVKNALVAIISCEFSESPEIAFSIVETFFNIGFMVAPVAGGALFELGGFYLPFTLLGVFLLCISSVHRFLPRDYKKQQSEFSKDILKLVTQPSVILGIFTVFGACFNISFVISILELHVKNLNLSPVQVGLVFLCNGIAFMFSSIFWSLLCDRYRNTLLISLLSVLIIIFGMLLLGPSPYLPFEMNLYTCVFGLFIIGTGVEGALVSGFSIINKGVSAADLPQNIKTSGFVSTLYLSSFALGNFSGPLIGGYVFEAFDFPWGSQLFTAYDLVLCIFLIVFQYPRNSCMKNRNNTDQLSASQVVRKNESFVEH